MKKKIGIIGAGRLGSALAKEFLQKGMQLTGISCQDIAESNAAAKKLGVKAFADNHELAGASEVIFLTVPDSLINKVAEELVAKGLRKGTILLHCSGAISGFALPFAEGVLRGSFHPLQSFAAEGAKFAGIYIALDGDEQTLKVTRRLCEQLAARPLTIPPGDRPLYHAAAVFASNYLITVLSAAEQLFARWADSETDARGAVMPLVNGTVANFAKFGAQKALTGPIARGDSETIRKHIQVLPVEFIDSYRNLGIQTVELARQTGNLPEEKIQEMKSILKGE